jgi:hypothetical protein
MSDINFDDLDKAAKSAPLTKSDSSKKKPIKNIEQKARLIHYPKEWEQRHVEHFGKTNMSSYIVGAFRDKLVNDGVL